MSVTGIADAVDTMNSLSRGMNDVAYVVGVGAEYGAYVEFGTSKMAAQPYLIPATQEVMNAEFDRHEAAATSMEDLVRRLAVAIEKNARDNAPEDTGHLKGSIEAFPAGVV